MEGENRRGGAAVILVPAGPRLSVRLPLRPLGGGLPPGRGGVLAWGGGPPWRPCPAGSWWRVGPGSSPRSGPRGASPRSPASAAGRTCERRETRAAVRTPCRCLAGPRSSILPFFAPERTGQWCPMTPPLWARRPREPGAPGVLCAPVSVRPGAVRNRQPFPARLSGRSCGAGRRPGTCGRDGSTRTAGTPPPRSRRPRRTAGTAAPAPSGDRRAPSVAAAAGARTHRSRARARWLLADRAVLAAVHPDIARCARAARDGASQTSRRDSRPLRNSLTTALRARRYSTRPPAPRHRESSEGGRPETHRHQGTADAPGKGASEISAARRRWRRGAGGLGGGGRAAEGGGWRHRAVAAMAGGPGRKCPGGMARRRPGSMAPRGALLPVGVAYSSIYRYDRSYRCINPPQLFLRAASRRARPELADARARHPRPPRGPGASRLRDPQAPARRAGLLLERLVRVALPGAVAPGARRGRRGRRGPGAAELPCP